MRPITTCVVLAALVTSACSSQYMPRSHGRVFVMMRGGGQAYVRDGQIYSHGLFGSGLGRAVAGNPEAERAADEYSSRMKTGGLAALGGILCSTVAFGLAIRDIDNQDYEDRGMPVAGWVALGCLAVSMGGLGYMITAEPYRWDAINIFNDTAPPAPVAPPGTPFGPPGGLGGLGQREKVSLQIED